MRSSSRRWPPASTATATGPSRGPRSTPASAAAAPGSCARSPGLPSARWSARWSATSAAATARSRRRRARSAPGEVGSRGCAAGTWTSRPGSRTASGCGSTAPAMPARRAAGPATSTSRSGSPRTSASGATATTWSASSISPRRRRWSAPRSASRRSTAPSRSRWAPGTQPGSESVLRGHGLPRLGGGRRGDQRLVFHVIVPSNLTEEQHRIAAQLEQTIGPENLEPEDGGGIFSRVRRAFG